VAYLIGSDYLIDYLAEDPNATDVIERLAAEPLFTSAMTYIEVFQGTLREDSAIDSKAKLDVFIEGAPILPVTREIAEQCARLRQALLEQGKRHNRRAFDLVIAATAIEHQLTLVTRNIRDYEDVPGMTLHR
jgi:predicted nucleic acid-binding protein